MADFNVNHISSKQGQQGPVLAGITTVNSTGSMRIPNGPTAHRGGRGRMIIAGGSGVTMNYLTIATAGNASDFGDLNLYYAQVSTLASSTRGVISGGSGPTAPTGTTNIDYTTISSQGGVASFGTLTCGKRTAQAPMSDGIRGLFAGGYGGASPLNYTNNIEMVTIASTGNSSDWGDMNFGSNGTWAGCASPTRGMFFGGYNGAVMNNISYVTIATQGEGGKNFGDLLAASTRAAAASNTTRGIVFGARVSPGGTYVNTIQYVTIATLGNAIDFGDLTAVTAESAAASSSTRAVNAGGENGSAAVNIIEYVTIAATGNATDFGDLTAAAGNGPGGCSDVHGGLG